MNVVLVFGDGGKVGLAITQATALTGVVTWAIRRSTEVANHLMAVERVLEYVALPEEKQPDVPKIAPQEWPQHGKVIFKDVGLKYDENGVSVLNNLNFTIQPKEKVRTLYTIIIPLIAPFVFIGRHCRKNWCWKVIYNSCNVSLSPS